MPCRKSLGGRCRTGRLFLPIKARALIFPTRAKASEERTKAQDEDLFSRVLIRVLGVGCAAIQNLFCLACEAPVNAGALEAKFNLGVKVDFGERAQNRRSEPLPFGGLMSGPLSRQPPLTLASPSGAPRRTRNGGRRRGLV